MKAKKTCVNPMLPTESSKGIKLGYLYVTLAAILWAISGSSSKFLFNKGLSPFQLIQLRTTLSFAGLLLWLIFRRPSKLKIFRKDIFYFFLLGTFGIAAAQFFYLYAISKIKVAAAILLHYTGPVFVAIYATVSGRERLQKITVLAILGTLVGCCLVVEAYNLDLLSMNRAGIGGGLLAAIAFATYTILGEYGMRSYSPWTVLFFALLFAALLWNILHPPFEAFFHAYSAVEWWWIFFIAVCGTILPFGLYFKGINLIRATHASITATLEPITAAAISYAFLNETMGPLQILGGAMVIASIILLQQKQEPDEKAPMLIRSKK
jgi:drug/metabolite transporter (DMT)-like permease